MVVSHKSFRIAIVQALKPLNLKKDTGLLTGLLTHKIVRERLEPDSRELATLFY
jgi:hypothetical protein